MGSTHPEMKDALCLETSSARARKSSLPRHEIGNSMMLRGPRIRSRLRRARLRSAAEGMYSLAFLRSSRLFLSLTRTFRGVTNRRKASPLVVSLLTNCKVQSRVRPQTCLAGQAC